MSDFSRRKFLKTGAAALAGITIALTARCTMKWANPLTA